MAAFGRHDYDEPVKTGLVEVYAFYLISQSVGDKDHECLKGVFASEHAANQYGKSNHGGDSRFLKIKKRIAYADGNGKYLLLDENISFGLKINETIENSKNALMAEVKNKLSLDEQSAIGVF